MNATSKKKLAEVVSMCEPAKNVLLRPSVILLKFIFASQCVRPYGLWSNMSAVMMVPFAPGRQNRLPPRSLFPALPA